MIRGKIMKKFIFKGWSSTGLIEVEVNAPDRESAIAYIEHRYPNQNFPLSQELI